MYYRLPPGAVNPADYVVAKRKMLSVAQLADGVAVLPANARTRQQMEWLAEEVVELRGQAGCGWREPAPLPRSASGSCKWLRHALRSMSI